MKQKNMDYRILARNELENINILNAALANSKNELNEINAALRSVKTSKYDGSVGANDPFSGENRIVSLIMRKDEVAQRHKQTRIRLDRINSALNVIPVQDRDLLLKCYCDNDSVYDIMDENGYERTAFYNRRNEALEKFTRAMYGVILT